MKDRIPESRTRTVLRRGTAPSLAVTSLAESLEGRVAPDSVDPAALEIGLLIRRLRKNRGLTQTGLAEASGLSQAAVSAIERGAGRDGPSYRILRDLARALTIDLAALLDAQISDEMPGQVEDAEKIGEAVAAAMPGAEA